MIPSAPTAQLLMAPPLKRSIKGMNPPAAELCALSTAALRSAHSQKPPWIFDRNGIDNTIGGLFGIPAKILVDEIVDILKDSCFPLFEPIE